MAMRVDSQVADAVAPQPGETSDRFGWGEVAIAGGAFAVLCVAVLVATPFLVEPDDFAYRASIVAITEGHFLTLSTAQFHALAAHLGGPAGLGRPKQVGGPVPVTRTGAAGAPGPLAPVGPLGIPQWVQLADGRWISEKDPGYPFLAAPFQALGIIRVAPLFYGALACVSLFFGARRWLGRYGGAIAVALYCCSGAAMLFAWRDYMPTFTEASLIAAGSAALLWALLADEVERSRRTLAGLLGFLALEAAAFVRYTDVVVLGCAAVTVVAVRRYSRSRVPPRALAWWLGSVVLFGGAVALFNGLVYGGPFKSGYRPGEIVFSFGSILPNFHYMPAHLLDAMPMFVLALAGLAFIVWRRLKLRTGPAGDEPVSSARRDFAVGLAVAASWLSVWGLYAAYTWTANPYGTTLQFSRFYVPALGAISLLAAYPIVRMARAARPVRMAAAAIVVALLVAGVWSYDGMRANGVPINRGPTIGKGVPSPAGGPQRAPG